MTVEKATESTTMLHIFINFVLNKRTSKNRIDRNGKQENKVVTIKTYQVRRLYQFHILQQSRDESPMCLLQLLKRKLHNTKKEHEGKCLAFYTKITFKEQFNVLPLDIGRIKSSINLSSMVSKPKSSRTAPYLFIVFGRMILNFVS